MRVHVMMYVEFNCVSVLIMYLIFRQKRTPITFETNGAGGKKPHKQDRSIYHPPSGKFSEKAGTFESNESRSQGKNHKIIFLIHYFFQEKNWSIYLLKFSFSKNTF